VSETPLVVEGVRLGVAQAGIKRAGKDDLTVIELAPNTVCAAVFTRNAFCAAPVHVARKHWHECDHQPRYWVVNTGNANAGTGLEGMNAAETTCHHVAALCGCSATDVMPFSTGVIGEPLPIDKLNQALPTAIENLSADGWERAASAILTTDTRPKWVSKTVTIGDVPVTLTGMSKGSGMICPDMATMLGFIATDAAIEFELLDAIFRRAVDASFNRITVDGDTSTNDVAVVAATGASGVCIDAHDGAAVAAFTAVLTAVCIELAQAIVRDGEGATKFVELRVEGGRNEAECEGVARTIAHSPLVKTALFASDPNWGRLLAAIGRAGLEDLIVDDVSIHLNGVLIAEHGARAASYTEEQGQEAMASGDLIIDVGLRRGQANATVWTTDLSYDYVRINAEYRT
jgi:glutamate N-acetyltransferase/amino-acid N-acetyltransferase